MVHGGKGIFLKEEEM